MRGKFGRDGGGGAGRRGTATPTSDEILFSWQPQQGAPSDKSDRLSRQSRHTAVYYTIISTYCCVLFGAGTSFSFPETKWTRHRKMSTPSAYSPDSFPSTLRTSRKIKISSIRTPILTHNSPKLEWNLATEKFEGFFLLSYAIFSFGKCLNYLISGFQMGDIFTLWQYWTKKIL